MKHSIIKHLPFLNKEEEWSVENRYLIVGLGNPGKNYRANRHNIGFAVLDKLADYLGETFKHYEQKSLTIKTQYEGKKVILAKPQTYMNLSGQAVRSLLRYYKIPLNQLLVVFDDVDLPLATIRLRSQGSSGGHRGVESIIAYLGSNEFPRLRVGIGRPSGEKNTADYVLENFTKTEMDILQFSLKQAVDSIRLFMTEGVEVSMNKFNLTNK